HTGPLDVTGDLEELSARVVWLAKACEPRRTAAQDGGHDSDRFNVVDRRRRPVEAHVGRERRLEPRHPLLAFQAFEQSRLLAADVRAGAVVDDDVEIPAVDVVLADETRLVSLVDSRLQPLPLPDELTPHVDEARVGAHREARHEAALDEHVRLVAENFAILAGARLRL